jgi:hypothetical protein
MTEIIPGLPELIPRAATPAPAPAPVPSPSTIFGLPIPEGLTLPDLLPRVAVTAPAPIPAPAPSLFGITLPADVAAGVSQFTGALSNLLPHNAPAPAPAEAPAPAPTGCSKLVIFGRPGTTRSSTGAGAGARTGAGAGANNRGVEGGISKLGINAVRFWRLGMAGKVNACSLLAATGSSTGEGAGAVGKRPSSARCTVTALLDNPAS